MNRPFIDSNVVLYLLSADTLKADRAENVIAAGGVISVQVLNEVTSVCMRKLRMPWNEIETLLAAVKSALEVSPLTLETHETAIELAKRYSLSFYDALICAAAIEFKADVIFSEDMQQGLRIDTLEIRNPFR